MTGGEGTYTYAWTLNATGIVTTSTYTVPSSAKEGDVITVTITDEEGNTASDSVIVGAANELALESVEGAAISNNRYNVVIAYFNQPVEDLIAGDVQIRRVSDDQLFAVESVSLSSDGMKATMTLANTNAAGATVSGLEANVDYNMIVTKDGEVASKVFYIPAVYSDATVTAVDADAETITIGIPYEDSDYAWRIADELTLTVPDDIVFDYFDLLGRTVTAKFDKNMNLTFLNVDADETVIYGAFKGSASNKNLTEVVSKASFKAQQYNSGTIRSSSIIAKNDKGWAAITDLDEEDIANDAAGFSFGKLVLNSNKTIKVLVAEENQLTPILVTGINNNVLLAGTTEQSVKDYTILEDGGVITVDDIEEGDVVFYNQAHKFALVYNNAETGSLDAVYDTKFTFEGTTYDVEHTESAAMLNSNVYFNKDGAGRTIVDNDYENALVAGGEDVTVYYGLNGQPAYLVGEVGEVVTTTETLVLTAFPKFYSEKLNDYYRVKGFNGEEVKTYDIDISKLEFIVTDDGTTYKKGFEPKAKTTANATANTTYKGFKVGTTAVATTGNGSIQQNGDPANAQLIESKHAGGANGTAADETLVKETLITLTFNDKGQVIGINFEDSDAGNTGMGDALSDGVDFKSGLKVVNGLQLDGSTPIYVYTESGTNKDTVSVTDYSDFTGVVLAANEGSVHVYSSNDKDVSAIVIQGDNLAGDITGQITQEVVVKSSKRNTESTTKLTELTVIYQGEETTYTDFTSGVAALTSPTAGSIYELKINKNGTTIEGLTAVGDQRNTPITVDSVDSQEFTLGTTTGWKLASTVTPTIVKFESGAYVPGTFADLQDADTNANTPMMVNWSPLDGSTHYVDTIVVTNESVAAAVEAAALTTMDAKLTALTGACTTLVGSATKTASATNKAAADAAKTAADTAITNWETASGKDFDTDASMVARKNAYDDDVDKITDYEDAVTELATATVTVASSPATLTSTTGTATLSTTGLGTDWTVTYAAGATGDTGTATVVGAILTGATAGTVTVTATASKAGYVDDAGTVTVTVP